MKVIEHVAATQLQRHSHRQRNRFCPCALVVDQLDGGMSLAIRGLIAKNLYVVNVYAHRAMMYGILPTAMLFVSERLRCIPLPPHLSSCTSLNLRELLKSTSAKEFLHGPRSLRCERIPGRASVRLMHSDALGVVHRRRNDVAGEIGDGVFCEARYPNRPIRKSPLVDPAVQLAVNDAPLHKRELGAVVANAGLQQAFLDGAHEGSEAFL